MNSFKYLAIVLAVLSLAACGKNTIPDPDPEGSAVEGSGANTGGMNDDGWGEGSEIPFGEGEGDEGEGELAMIIFFDFDQSEVRANDQATLAAHATRLANLPSATIRLEGHADERGSREYNIGLGERRSQAVRKILLIQGASAQQISTVSFGEERPAAFGSDEESYAQNRRVEIRFVQ